MSNSSKGQDAILEGVRAFVLGTRPKPPPVNRESAALVRKAVYGLYQSAPWPQEQRDRLEELLDSLELVSGSPESGDGIEALMTEQDRPGSSRDYGFNVARRDYQG